MTYKNGIYLSLNGDSAVRIISENGSRIQTDVIKIADELLGEGQRRYAFDIQRV